MLHQVGLAYGDIHYYIGCSVDIENWAWRDTTPGVITSACILKLFQVSLSKEGKRDPLSVVGTPHRFAIWVHAPYGKLVIDNTWQLGY